MDAHRNSHVNDEHSLGPVARQQQSHLKGSSKSHHMIAHDESMGYHRPKYRTDLTTAVSSAADGRALHTVQRCLKPGISPDILPTQLLARAQGINVDLIERSARSLSKFSDAR